MAKISVILIAGNASAKVSQASLNPVATISIESVAVWNIKVLTTISPRLPNQHPGTVIVLPSRR